MSELEIALWKRIAEIVTREKRHFDYTDFVPKFTLDEQVYSISHGTFRNYMSNWVRAEKLEVKGYSPQALYSLKGVSFENPMTRDHTGALLRENKRLPSNNPIYRIIQNVPFGQRALHDIRLRFHADGIWSIF